MASSPMNPARRARHSILLGVFLSLFAFSRSPGAAETPADLVVRNGDILTVATAFSHASALAIKDGVFVAVGSNDDVQKWVGPGTRTIEARGAMVIPGLLESHVHATGAARGE